MSEFDMVENAQKERDKGVRYSVVKDQNGYPFVENSRGSIDFGTISNLVGMENAPIRLSSGFDSIDKNGKHHGYDVSCANTHIFRCGMIAGYQS